MLELDNERKSLIDGVEQGIAKHKGDIAEEPEEEVRSNMIYQCLNQLCVGSQLDVIGL